MIDLFDESTSKNYNKDNLNDSFLNNFENSRDENEPQDFGIQRGALDRGEFNFLESGLDNVDNQNILDDPFQNMFSGSNYGERPEVNENESNPAGYQSPKNNDQAIGDFGENMQIETDEPDMREGPKTTTQAEIQPENQTPQNYANLAESRKTSTGMEHMFLLPNQQDHITTDSQKHFKSGSNSTHSGNTRSRDNSIQPSEMNINPYQTNEFGRNLIMPMRGDHIQKNIFSGIGTQSPSDGMVTFQNSENSRMSKRGSSGKKRRRRKKKSGKMLITEENYTENFDYKQFINQELAKLGMYF